MKVRIECPYCDGQAILKIEPKELSFRKEKFRVREHYYRCEKCKEQFTTTESDTLTMLQLYNQYREKHDVPFPEEIRSLREKYKLSASKMSFVLGLGVNSYTNYEKGEVPSLANANLIGMAQNPQTFLDLIEKVKSSFSENIYVQVVSAVHERIEKSSSYDPFSNAINFYTKPNGYTGYKVPDLDKIIGLISVILNNCKEKYNDRLKLNKMLFYTDFINYKNTGSSITGITYRAIKLGPVPTYYDNIYALLESNNQIISEFCNDGSGGAREILKAQNKANKEIFTLEELESIELVISKFKDTPTWDVVNKSHKELAWKKLSSENKIINYQEYAFDINGL